MPSSVHSDEPTEMTAMTDPGMTSPIPEVTSSHRMSRDPSFQSRDEEGESHVVIRGFTRSPAGKCILAFLVVLAVSVLGYQLAKITMGSLYINSCPVDRWVPIYLVVSSSLVLVFTCVFLLVFLKCRRKETNNEESVASHHLIALVYFFLHLVLQLAGSVCVIKTRNDVIDPQQLGDPEIRGTPGLHCDQGLLEFAYGVVIFELVLSGIVLTAVVLVLIEAIYLVCCNPEGEKQGTES